jgi:hypothetical protein
MAGGDKRFGGLPPQGGVQMIGSDKRLVLDGSQGRQGPGPGRPPVIQRKLRSDQLALQIAALTAQGRETEARALRDGNQRGPAHQVRGDDAQHLVDSGRARHTDGSAVAPGSAVPRIVESALTHRRGPGPDVFVVPSADGTTYELLKALAPKKDPDAMWRAGMTNTVNGLMMAVREIMIGGDPVAIFDALGIQLQDARGQTLFPIPAELRGIRPQLSFETDDENDANQFAHGLESANFPMATFEEPYVPPAAPRSPPKVSYEEVPEPTPPRRDAQKWGPTPEQAASKAAPVHPVDALTRLLGQISSEELEAALGNLPPEQLIALGFGSGAQPDDNDDAGAPVDAGSYGDPEVDG